MAHQTSTTPVPTSATTSATTSAPTGAGRPRPGVSSALGGFYLAMAGINTGMTIADATVYRHFADQALFGFVRSGWTDIVMARPTLWIMMLAGVETLIGVGLLVGGRAARAGWVAVIGFHLLLLLFGWGFWLYAVPALIALAAGVRRDWDRLA
jgi:hypothetical protein